jgi:hypothetical protein
MHIDSLRTRYREPLPFIGNENKTYSILGILLFIVTSGGRASNKKIRAGGFWPQLQGKRRTGRTCHQFHDQYQSLR